MAGYYKALEAAGATVHDFKMFGSYQGRWLADVTLPDGRKGLIAGYYGSCSGCDAYEAEFSFDIHDYQDHKDGTPSYEFVEDCEKCQELKEKLAKFGESYFSDLTTAKELAENRLKDTYWSTYDEDVDYAKFIYDRLNARTSLAKKLKERMEKGYE